jgi:hypothetical protein
MLFGDKPDRLLWTRLRGRRAGYNDAIGFEGQMNDCKHPSPVMRQELEECWRLRVEKTQNQCRERTEQYRKLLQEQLEGRRPNPNGALALAQQAESQALAAYMHVLRLFNDLIMHDKIPEDRPAASSNGV